MNKDFLTVVFSDNAQTSKLIKSFLSEVEFISDVVSCSKDFYIDKNDNIIAIVDLTCGYNADFILELSSKSSNIRVLALGEEPSVDLIVKSMRSGAKEFLPFPLIKSEFVDAVNRLSNKSTVKPESKCMTISIFSNKGGIGKTSIATNLALELARITKEKVALIDLNFQMGDVTTFMDLSPSFNISNMLQNLDKVSEEFLLGTLENYKNTSLYVLADPPFLKQADEISSGRLSNLLEILKKTFSYIVIDLEASFDSKNIAALTLSNLIFLVTVANLPAIRNSQRCLDLFDKLGLDNVQILLNRFMENDDISVSDVEKVIGRKLYWKIPNNYFTIMSSINKGIPVVDMNPESNVAKSYRDLALKLSDRIYRENLIKKYESILGGNIGLK